MNELDILRIKRELEVFHEITRIIKAESHDGRMLYVGYGSYLVDGRFDEPVGCFQPYYNNGFCHKIEIYGHTQKSAEDGYDSAWMILPHEFGHYLSFKKGLQPKEVLDQYDAYRDMGKPELLAFVLSEKQKWDFIGEENRAWEFAETLLRKLGIWDFSEFNEYRRKCVMTYKKHLGLDIQY